RLPTSPLFPYTTLFRSPFLAVRFSRLFRIIRYRVLSIVRLPSLRGAGGGDSGKLALGSLAGGAPRLFSECDPNDSSQKVPRPFRSEEHTSELQSLAYLV